MVVVAPWCQLPMGYNATKPAETCREERGLKRARRSRGSVRLSGNLVLVGDSSGTSLLILLLVDPENRTCDLISEWRLAAARRGLHHARQ